MENGKCGNKGDIYLKERLKAILIGTNHYWNLEKKNNLYGPRNDVECIRLFLTEQWHIDNKDILVLKDPSRDRALNEIRKFCSKLEKEDHLLFYFAGHCDQDPESGKSFLFYANTQKELEESKIRNVLSIDSLNHYFLKCKAGVQVRVFDCCHSGERLHLLKDYFDKNGVYEGIAGPEAQNLPQTVEAESGKEEEEKAKDKGIPEESFRKLMKNQKGWVTFCACNIDEIAEESIYEENGVWRGLFSYYFLKGLEIANKASAEKPFYIEDLKNYVYQAVLDDVKRYPNGGPWLDENNKGYRKKQHVQYQCSNGGNIIVS